MKTALQDLDVFVRAAELGSLSAAARALELTPAAASAALKRLEAELGTVLLLRSTRSLRLSEAGERFLAECRPALQALQQAGRELQAGGDARLRGTLRLTMPSDLGRNLLLPWLDDFQQQHPQVELRLQLSDRNADVYSTPVDAALRYGEPPDSSLVALALDPHNRRQLCASPDYLQRRGTPAEPADLVEHDCLSYMLGDEVHDRWPFYRADDEGPPHVQRVRAKNVANDGDVVRRWALAGRGIAYKSRLDIAGDLAAGRLVPLCPGWLGAPAPLFLVVADRRQLSPLLRALREFLMARLGDFAR